MADRPWRTAIGLGAVLLWSAVLGIPVLAFHLNSISLDFGQHLHAAILFFGSQALVYWLAARPQKDRPQRAKPTSTVPSRPIPAAAIEDNQIWEAEVVAPNVWDVPPIPSRTSPNGTIMKCIVTNYLGSSRPRLVCIEPGGTKITLLPGQDLELTAASQGGPPVFRIVESDMATQVFFEGDQVAITTKPLHGRLVS